MGNSLDIKQADRYLDAHRPAKFMAAGVRRSNNIYAFIGDATTVINITDGQKTPLAACQTPGFVWLRLAADEEHCYVSDLDLYDDAKAAVAQNKATEHHAANYWQHIVPLKNYHPYEIRRPEVMITRAVPAERIMLA